MSLWRRLLGLLLGGARAPKGPSVTPAPPPPVIVTPPRASAPAARAVPNPYEGSQILGLSPEEMRKRALTVDPYKTAWIGRVDTIPPQSDERTALIDRGLMLRGLLTEEQLREIHEVGDLWLLHHESDRLAASIAQQRAGEEVARRKAERLAEKRERKRGAEERRRARAEAVAARRAGDIVYLGRGVSKGLADRRAHVEALEAAGLPVLAAPADVAQFLGISVPKLRWLAFHTEAAERSHYVHFEVPKRSGGTRLLSAPHRDLAAAQQRIRTEILEKVALEGPAHGFVRGRSTVTNARPHLGQAIVVNLDLSDFFPTITFPRVRGVFQRLGYSPAAATCLALLCTDAPRRLVRLDGVDYRVAVGERALPQGACTSPALSNLVARRLDRRLQGVARKRGLAYTRYADDLTFSLPPERAGECAPLLASVRHIVAAESFVVHPGKGRVQRSGGRQTVTGIVVNEKPGVPREEVRRLRAILHAAGKTGLPAQNRENRPAFEAWLRGRIAYVMMVDRAKGEALMNKLDILEKAPGSSPG